jgi:hypothetical protein
VETGDFVKGALVTSPLTIPLVELVKMFWHPGRWYPLVVVGCGEAIAWLWRATGLDPLGDQNWAAVTLTGLVSAFMAAGLYSQAKTVAGK